MISEIFNVDPYQKTCNSIVRTVDQEQRWFTVNQTVFYPTGGGQPGDTGAAFYENDLDVGIIDTRRDRETGEIRHYVDKISHMPLPGHKLFLELDWERRYGHMRMHSCIHLLCAAVPGRVTGNQIYADRGRVDFDLEAPLEKEFVTLNLNELISQKAERSYMEFTYDEIAADRQFFRSLSIPPPQIEGLIRLVHFKGIDIQPCGGTHVANVAEIGQAQITKIDNKGKHNKRMSIVLD